MLNKQWGANAFANGSTLTRYNYNLYPPKIQLKTLPEQLYFTQRFIWIPTTGDAE